MNCYLNPYRGSSKTLIGAVSTQSRSAYVEVHPKTKSEYVIAFLENYLPLHRGGILVLDNHASHKSQAVKAVCQKYHVKLAFLPSVSSNLNPVERYWSVVKAEWSKYLVAH